MTKQPLYQPTAEELFAMKVFAAKAGVQWKSKLMELWIKGADVGPELQRIRNRLGPSGLMKFKFGDE